MAHPESGSQYDPTQEFDMPEETREAFVIVAHGLGYKDGEYHFQQVEAEDGGIEFKLIGSPPPDGLPAAS